ncbi:MAG: hypothetical protein J1F65_03855 [Clostridiales bacterium]|nr:hypothetical protein [Clostridiales bacterium]
MKYIETVLNFLNGYAIVILPILFAVVPFFGVVNWASNVYRRQNRKIKACYRGICAKPDKAELIACLLPEDYRRQWRAFVNSKADKASLVFEFVKKDKRPRLLWLVIVAAICSSAYIAVFFFVAQHFSYLIFQAVYMLAFGLVMVINSAVGRHQERKAKRIFARLVAELNKCYVRGVGKAQTRDPSTEIKQLSKQYVNGDVVDKASELLHDKGLETDRTVEQQRKLNKALNGLLQAYARNAAK